MDRLAVRRLTEPKTEVDYMLPPQVEGKESGYPSRSGERGTNKPSGLKPQVGVAVASAPPFLPEEERTEVRPRPTAKAGDSSRSGRVLARLGQLAPIRRRRIQADPFGGVDRMWAGVIETRWDPERRIAQARPREAELLLRAHPGNPGGP